MLEEENDMEGKESKKELDFIQCENLNRMNNDGFQGIEENEIFDNLENQNEEMESELNPKEMEKIPDLQVLLTINEISHKESVIPQKRFYKISVRKYNSSFYVLTKFGKLGTKNTQYSFHRFDDLDSALELFKKRFQEKTMIKWEERHGATPKPGKFFFEKKEDTKALMREMEIAATKMNDKANTIISLLKFPQNDEMACFIYDILNPEEVFINEIKKYGIDSGQFPLESFNNEKIIKGMAILLEIQLQILKGAKDSLISDYSKLFFSTFISKFFEKQIDISSVNLVGKYNNLLNIIQDLLVSKDILDEISQEFPENNDICQIFTRSINQNILVSPKSSDEFQFISDLISKSQCSNDEKFQLELQSLIFLSNKSESVRFFPFKKLNRYILFHSVNNLSIPKILKSGLDVPIRNSPSISPLGKAIYFTNSSTRALESRAKSLQTFGYVLICEVALGNIYKTKIAQKFSRPPINFHSVQGQGTFTMTSSEEIPKGFRVFKDLKEDYDARDFKFDNFAVYDSSQIAIRYAAKVKIIY